LYEGPHSFELGGQRVLVVHDIGDVQPRSIEGHSIVVHGFTHQQEMKHRGDTLIVNPGEACGWLYGTPKAAILDLDTKQVEFLSLDPAHWTT
jgi:predicted phosphodiesterase